MRARLSAFLRPIVYVVILLAGLLSGGGQRVAAQEAPMRWDGYFELISGRWPYPPPWTNGLYASDAENHVSRHPISADGRYVIFDSDATNMGYSTPAVYRRDRDTGQTEVFIGGPMREVALSASGDHLAGVICDGFMRSDWAPICDIYAEHVGFGGIVPLSTTADGTLSDADSSDPVLSANGRFVVFVTRASNLSGGPIGIRQIVVRDRDSDGNGIFDEPGTAVLQTISTNAVSGAAGDNDSDTPEVSDDGRFVAFRSLASNLAEGDTNGTWDVFVRDRQTGEVRRINVGPEGQQSSSSVDWGQLSMSADGRFVAFASEDGLLAPATQDDINGVLDVFVYDRDNPAFLVRVDIMSGWPIAGGYILGNGPTGWPRFSADGRYLAVQSKITSPGAPPSDRNQVYVVDRALGNVTRVSVKRSGGDPADECARPAISGDGSVVLFMSKAMDLAGLPSTSVDQLFAAVHLEITPNEAIVPGRGGQASFTVTTQPHTLWWADWDFSQYWFGPVQAPYGVGSGVMTFEAREPNPDPVQRSMSIYVGQATATFTQDVGLSLTSVTPTSGPMSGGTLVTLRGTGFEPGMTAYFGEMVPTEFVDSTTLRAVTPPSTQRGFTLVGVNTIDYRWDVIENGFFYLDSTPPDVYGWANGYAPRDDWFITDVAVNWYLWDQESEITSTTCAQFTVTTDTPGTTFTCSATSEGGTGYGSVTVKRDTTPPTVTIRNPVSTMYKTGAFVLPEIECADATSGVALCTSETNGGPIDTIGPGYRTYYAWSWDQAENSAITSVEYAVPEPGCFPLWPEWNVQGWWRFEGDTAEWMSQGQDSARFPLAPDVFVEGMIGQAYYFEGEDGYLATNVVPSWAADKRFTIAAWVKPSADNAGTIVRRRDAFSVARLANGHLAWAFRKFDVPGLSYFDTGVAVPLNLWTHVAVVLDGTTVYTYLNGRLAHTANNIGDVYNLTPSYTMTIGGGEDVTDYFKGGIDEVQVLAFRPFESDVQLLFLSAEGACVPLRTRFLIQEPIEARYGDATYPIDVLVVDQNEAPASYQPVTIESRVSAPPYVTSTYTGITDDYGRVHWDAPLNGASPGLYEHFVTVTSQTTPYALRASATPDVHVGLGTPVITWPEPAAIPYGTPISAAQLNATANVAGAFTYSLPPGATMPVGVHTLFAIFTPEDSNYETTIASVSLTVTRATPTVAVTGGSFVFDGAPHPATGTVTGVGGETLGPLTFTYNGSTDPPVNAGSYTVVGSFAGDLSYVAATGTATIVVQRAAPSLTWSAPSPIVYGTALGTAQLNASANLPGSFSYTPVAGTVPSAGAGQVLTATFTPIDSANYVNGSVSTTIDVGRAVPSVSVTGGTFVYDGQAHPATGTVTGIGGTTLAPLTVTYNGSPDVPVNAGTYAVVGSFAGDANYEPASANASLTIAKAAVALQWPAPAPVVYGTTLGDAQLNATASVAGSFSYSPSAGATLDAGPHALTAIFTPADAANYEPGTVATTIAVQKATPVLSATGGTFTYDGLSHGATATVMGVGGASLTPVIFAYNGSPDAPVNAGTYEAIATFQGSANYEPASGTATVTILRAAAVLSWPAPAPITYGTALGAMQLDATANAAGAFSYSPSSGTVLTGGSHTLSAAFTPADSVNYEDGVVTTTLTVLKATPAVVVAGGTFVYDGQPHGATATVTGVGGVALGPVTFTYNASPDVPVNAGTYDAVATFGGDENYEAVSGSAIVTIGKAVAALSWTPPEPIVYGTPLGAAQLNATANIAGTFSYSPAAGTVLNAAAGQPLVATFTPADPGNYTGGSVSTTMSVAPAPLTIRANDATKRFGAPLPPFSASFAGFVNGDTPSSLAGTLVFSTAATPASPVGTYPIVPSGLASSNYTIGFANGILTVVKGAVIVSTSASPEPSGLDMRMTFTAALTAEAPSVGSPSGSISFYEGTTRLGTASVSGGSATLSTAGFDAGSHTIEARYDGDDSFESGTGSVAHFVNTAETTPSVSLTSSRNPASSEATVTLTAAVDMPGAIVSGTVAFYNGGTPIGSAPISAGRATLATTTLPLGSNAITARYLGSADAPPAISPVFVQAISTTGWKNRSTTTAIGSSMNPSALDDPVVFTATVIGGSNSAPTGRVLFMVDGEVYGDPAGVPVVPVSGTTVRASVSIADLPHGRHKVTATYLGNEMYRGSTAGLAQTVN